MPASARSSASRTSRGAVVSGRGAICSIRMLSAGAPTRPRARRPGWPRPRGWPRRRSSATRSPGWIARQTSMALRAPGASSGENGPNTVAVDITFLASNDEGGHLPAARGDVGQSGRAEARQEAGDAPAEQVRREVDQHVALDDAVGLADREGLAADRDPLLGDPAALGLAQRPRDRRVPRALVGLPAERHAGAAVLVVRLEHEALAVRRRYSADRSSAVAVVPSSRTTRVHGTCAAIGSQIVGVEQVAVAVVGQHREERLLVRDLAAQLLATQTAPRAVGVDQRAALVGPRHDVVDEHAAVDQIDRHAVGDQRAGRRRRGRADRRSRSGRRRRRTRRAAARTRSTSAPRASRRSRCAAGSPCRPSPVAREQRVEQVRDRRVVADVEPLAEAVHQRLAVEQLRQPLAVAGPGRALRVVLGELQRVGQEEGVGARRRCSPTP